MKQLKKLLLLLSQIEEGYRLMAEKTEAEKSVIEKGRLADLGKIIKEKQAVGLAIKTLEEKRLELLKEMESKIGHTAGGLTLGALADMPENRTFRKKILTIREKLLKAAARAKELNDFNRALVGRAMLSVMDSIKFANALAEPAVTYSPTREIKTRKTPGTMVKKFF